MGTGIDLADAAANVNHVTLCCSQSQYLVILADKTLTAAMDERFVTTDHTDQRN